MKQEKMKPFETITSYNSWARKEKQDVIDSLAEDVKAMREYRAKHNMTIERSMKVNTIINELERSLKSVRATRVYIGA